MVWLIAGPVVKVRARDVAASEGDMLLIVKV
jgi:hypothetical protein